MNRSATPYYTCEWRILLAAEDVDAKAIKLTDPDKLYEEVKAEIQTVADPLFDFAEQCLSARGNFLPQGAVLRANGQVDLIAAAPENEVTDSTEVLPLLHEGLRVQAKDSELTAIGVVENVTVTLGNQPSTDAIKVLCEHKCGLVVALYEPFRKRFMRGYTFGRAFTVFASGEVNAWPEPNAEPVR